MAKANSHLLAILSVMAVVFYGLYMIQPVPFCVQYTTSGQSANEPSNNVNYSKAVYQLDALTEIKSTIAEKGYYIFNTEGNSMFPAIKSNSNCVCNLQQDYKLNDIVAYFISTDNQVTGYLHRIVSVSPDYLIVKGDNNPIPDLPIIKSDIVCAVPQIPRYLLPQNPIEQP